MSKPVFVLLHGAWHSPQSWDLLTAELDRAGYRSVTPRLPSSADRPRDVETIRKAVSDLVEEDDVVVVIHSYSFSGMTGGASLEGLDKQTCVSKGLRGGVIRLVYIVSFLVPEGFQHSPRGGREEFITHFRVDPETRACPSLTPSPDQHPRAGAPRGWKGYARPGRGRQDRRRAEHHHPRRVAGYPDHVRAVPERASGRRKIDNVIEFDGLAGHSPFLHMPRWTAEMLISEAGRRA